MAAPEISIVTKTLALPMAGVLVFFYVDGFLVGAPSLLVLVLGLLGLLVLVGFFRHADHGPIGPVQAASVTLAALSALVVLALSRGGSISPVLAAALVGCAGGGLQALGRPRGRWQGVAAPTYCGAFAGMTSELLLGHPAWVLLAGGLAGLLLSVLNNSWSGIGGKLGTIAFLAVLAACGVAILCGAIGTGPRLHSYLDHERAFVLVVCLLSPLLTHALSYRWDFGIVLGSALPSLLVAMLAPTPIAAMWLGASFVGMTAPHRLAPHPVPLLLAMGLLFGLLGFGFEPSLAGIGGDLGATAAVSVFAVLGVRALKGGGR